MLKENLQNEENTRKRKSNLRFLLGTLLVIGAIAFLVFTSLENEIYYYTVSEVGEQIELLEGETFRIKGNVVPQTHFLREGTLDEHIFTLVAENQTIEISFLGALPDTFSDNAEVVALGRLINAEHFEATEVVAKCPSRYENGAPTGEDLDS